MRNDRNVIYLRKSRADYEAEKRGEGETFSRHRKILSDFTSRNSIPVSDVYAEIVSGETISARPLMQRLLTEVEQGCWDGVIVMELERLARGDTIDQGIVAQTFKYSHTKIITPVKTYDPSDEFDEEYFEFGLFMSRREYKTINRRLQRGRLLAVTEGKYIAATAPFGYRRVRLLDNSGYTLAIDPGAAETVRFIFRLYTEEKPGIREVCKRLEARRMKNRSGTFNWSPSTVRDILSNPVYAGKIRWQWRKTIKEVKNGKLTTARSKNPDCILCDGLHPAIVSWETFCKAQEVLALHAKRRPCASSPTALNGLTYNPTHKS